LKDIYIRTLTGIFFLVAVLGSVLLSPFAFFGLFFIFAFIGLNEFFLLSDSNNGRKKNVAFYILGMFIYSLIGLIGLNLIDIRYAYLLLLVFPVTIIHELFRKTDASWNRIGTYFSGFFYVAFPFGLLNALFLMPDREGYWTGILIGLFVIVWSNDIFAYLTGSLLGRHKLFERVSPKKSWEGSIGGLVFALLAAWILSMFFTEINLTDWMILAVIIAITGSLGDLSESLLKRKAGVKDSGNIFPGHGGVLDRFDATLFAVPFVFVYINLFSQ